ncbi:neuralized-like protein 2 [Ciona intestinalis]
MESNLNTKWDDMGTSGQFRFHPNCGSNIRLSKDNLIARRVEGFSNAVCFSESPLLSGQLFLIEIKDTDKSWSGHLRVGITQINPNLDQILEMVVPMMVDDGRTWALAITKFHNRVSDEDRDLSKSESVLNFGNSRVNSDYLCFAGKRALTYNRNGTRMADFGQAVLRGSRIGIVLRPVTSQRRKLYCNLHLVINGEDMGAVVTRIPLTKPLYAVVDVYSITKEVKILSLPAMTSLTHMCRDVIRDHVSNKDNFIKLGLPHCLQAFVEYGF